MSSTSPDTHVQLHAIIEGHVQGVGFREFVLRNSLMLKLTGWVRNVFDGSVEICAEGSRTNLETLVEKMKTGPSGATVTDIKMDWDAASGEFSTFTVARSV